MQRQQGRAHLDRIGEIGPGRVLRGVAEAAARQRRARAAPSRRRRSRAPAPPCCRSRRSRRRGPGSPGRSRARTGACRRRAGPRPCPSRRRSRRPARRACPSGSGRCRRPPRDRPDRRTAPRRANRRRAPASCANIGNSSDGFDQSGSRVTWLMPPESLSISAIIAVSVRLIRAVASASPALARSRNQPSVGPSTSLLLPQPPLAGSYALPMKARMSARCASVRPVDKVRSRSGPAGLAVVDRRGILHRLLQHRDEELRRIEAAQLHDLACRPARR